MCCVLNVSTSCLSDVLSRSLCRSHSTKGHCKSFLFSQRSVLLWCVVETSCGCAEPQDIWMHCSCAVASFRKHYDSPQLQSVCLLRCRKMKSNTSTDTAGHTEKVPYNDSGHKSLTPVFKFPVAALSRVHPCIYLKCNFTWDGLKLPLSTMFG